MKDILGVKRESTHPSTKSFCLVRCGLRFFAYFLEACFFLDADILFFSGVGMNVDVKRYSGICLRVGFGLDDVESSSSGFLFEIISSSESLHPRHLLTTLLILVRTLSRHLQPIFFQFTVLFPSIRIALSILLTTSFSALLRFLSSTLDPSLPFLPFFIHMCLFQRFVPGPCRVFRQSQRE